MRILPVGSVDETVQSLPWYRNQSAFWQIQVGGLFLVVFLSFFPEWSHFQEYLFISLLVMAIGTAWSEGKPIWVRTPVDLPVLCFIGWVLLSVPFAIDVTYSFEEWRKLVVKIIAFYWTLLVLREQSQDFVQRGVLGVLTLGALCLGTYAIVDFVDRGGTLADRIVRARAPGSDYNWLSTYLVMVTPFIIGTAYLYGRSLTGFLCWATSGLALGAQFLSYTRAGWLGVAAQVLTFGLIIRWRCLAAGLLAACIVAGLGLWAVSEAGYQHDTLALWTLETRLEAWKLGIAETLSHPMVGIGYGNGTFLERFAGTPEAQKISHLHNTFLMMAMGSGIPAVLFLLGTLGAACLTMMRAERRTTDLRNAAILLATTLMIIGFTVRNMFDDMFTGSLAYLFWILVAFGVTSTQYIIRESRIT